MKKILAILLAAITAFSMMAAFAAMSPEPEIKIDTDPEHPEYSPNFYFKVSYDESKHRQANAILADLSKAEAPADFFGEAAAKITETLGKEEFDIVEFAPVIAGNYVEEMGNVKLTIECPTKYAEGQKVAVLFGIDNNWSVYEGVGTADGKVQVTLDPTMVLAVQNNELAIMAIAI